MRRLFVLALFAALSLALLDGCATVDYFTKAENQQTLIDLGLTCFQGPDVKVGVAYIIKKQGTDIQPTTTGEFLVGCGDKWYSVICDVTKGPSENPCSDLREYDLKTVPPGTTFVPAVPEIPAEPSIPPA